MTRPQTNALALELLALGRAFLFRVAHQSHFGADLIPYRIITNGAEAKPIPRTLYNPALGRSLSDMLHRVIRAAGRGDWADAQCWCEQAMQVKGLPAVYRGDIDVELADAVVQFYRATTLVGLGDSPAALDVLNEFGEQLAFTMPDCACAFWLASARICVFQHNLGSALWALEKSSGLSRDCRPATRNLLRPLLETEYSRVALLDQ